MNPLPIYHLPIFPSSPLPIFPSSLFPSFHLPIFHLSIFPLPMFPLPQMLSSRLMRVGSGLSKLTARKKTNASAATGAKNLLPTFQEYVLWTTSHATVVRELVSMQVRSLETCVWVLYTWCIWMGTEPWPFGGRLRLAIQSTVELVVRLTDRPSWKVTTRSLLCHKESWLVDFNSLSCRIFQLFSLNNFGKRSCTCRISSTTNGWRPRSS